MRRWFVFALVSIPIALLSLTPAAATFTAWTVDGLEKVRPSDPVPAKLQSSIHLFAARNEFEPFQVVLRTETGEVRNVDVEMSDFKSASGGIILRQNITVYLESFINLDQPSSMEGRAGEWPDALIPRVDRYHNEKRNAFPFKLPAARNQPLWFDVYIPSSTRPGDYAAQVVISVDGKPQMSIPVALTVWSFALPSTSSLPTSFGFNGVSALRQHKSTYTNDDDLYALTEDYAKAALWHRISLHGGSLAPPHYEKRGGRLQVDWTAYDAEVGPLLDGRIFSASDPLPGARATTVDLRDAKGLANDQDKIQYYREYASHFRKKGWIDRLFYYLWDEPKSSDSAALIRRGKLIRAADPQLRSALTAGFRRDWADVVDIWVPLLNCMERRSGFDDFCEAMAAREVYGPEIERGKKLWWYQSCSSHGCSGPGGEYFRGFPSYMIDYSGVANRIMPWLAWKYSIQGELYFNLNEAYFQRRDVWSNVYLFGGNGDGTLVYPGKPDKIGGRTDIPIESIRLKLIREGLEDYEYLVLMAAKTGRLRAGEIVDSFVHKIYEYDHDPATMRSVRQRIGEELQ